MFCIVGNYRNTVHQLKSEHMHACVSTHTHTHTHSHIYTYNTSTAMRFENINIEGDGKSGLFSINMKSHWKRKMMLFTVPRLSHSQL